jgi:hypothetical protein
VRLRIDGPPRTKKTHNVVVLRPGGGKGQPCPHCKQRILADVHPSRQWRQWVKQADVYLDGAQLVRTTAKLLVLVRSS